MLLQPDTNEKPRSEEHPADKSIKETSQDTAIDAAGHPPSPHMRGSQIVQSLTTSDRPYKTKQGGGVDEDEQALLFGFSSID